MLTITQLATACGVSRATVLYYEKAGLLSPRVRSENGYRWYGDAEEQRLRKIVQFRKFGVAVSELSPLLEQENKGAQTEILESQFSKLEQQITELRKQQSAIVELLQLPKQQEQDMVTKERWVEIMRASGFSDEDMIAWHQNFERMEPNEHQKFLESLGIAQEEIQKIRAF